MILYSSCQCSLCRWLVTTLTRWTSLCAARTMRRSIRCWTRSALGTEKPSGTPCSSVWRVSSRAHSENQHLHHVPSPVLPAPGPSAHLLSLWTGSWTPVDRWRSGPEKNRQSPATSPLETESYLRPLRLLDPPPCFSSCLYTAPPWQLSQWTCVRSHQLY